MSDNAKKNLLKKLKIASEYKKMQSTLAKESDKAGEFKLKQKDKKQIYKIKKQLNGGNK